MNDSLKRKYIAVKPSGFNYYIWFEQEKVETNTMYFFGKSGWGKNGSLTNLQIKHNEIDAYIYSDELQYT